MNTHLAQFLVHSKCVLARGYHHYSTILHTGPQSLSKNSRGQVCSGMQNFGGVRKVN